jgi:peptidoglycan/LPS O-acetylase OafA/YrhL
MLSKPYSLITLTLAVAGAFVVVTTFAFAQGTANAIDFAVAIGATVLGAAALASAPSEARRAHRTIAAGVVVLGAWTILVTLGIFSGATQEWIVFGAGAAIAAAGLAGHGLYEAGRERRLATLEGSAANGTVTVEGRPRVATAA